MARKALIYGISGQDGAYLCDFLLSKGYSVAGTVHSHGGEPVPQIPKGAKSYSVDLAAEPEGFLRPIGDFAPDEIYNLAGINPQHITPQNSLLAEKVNARAPEAMLAFLHKRKSSARFFQASSGYIFGARAIRADECTAPAPEGVYARTKLAAQQSAAHYRRLGVFASAGILFNHESPLRTEDFVTRKISAYVAREKLGQNGGKPLLLGNLDARRDWGFAGDYVEAMWLMLQQGKPDDYVIASGESHSVREFCQEAFSYAGLDWEKCVRSDPAYFRPAEVDCLQGDASKARKELGWKPRVGFKELAHMMVDADLVHIKKLHNL